MDALISVVIPVYKTEQYLRRCVTSILNQTYTNLEIILVDDGSPDTSGELCDKLALEDSRIKVVHKKNGGLSSARNAGVDVSDGQYICFVDSDDYIEKDYVEVLHDLLVANDADLAKIDYAEVTTSDYSEPAAPFKAHIYRGCEVERAYLELKVDSACVFLYKKELIGDTRFPEGKTSEDIPFNFEIFQKAKAFVYAPTKKYYYYYNTESISNGPLNKNMLNYLLFREAIYQHYQNRGDKYLCDKAEALFARAAMGLMARMALYGVAPNLDEKAHCKLFRDKFMLHKKSYFIDNDIPISRKVVAVAVFWFYPLVKCLRGKVK